MPWNRRLNSYKEVETILDELQRYLKVKISNLNLLRFFCIYHDWAWTKGEYHQAKFVLDEMADTSELVQCAKNCIKFKTSRKMLYYQWNFIVNRLSRCGENSYIIQRWSNSYLEWKLKLKHWKYLNCSFVFVLNY